MHLNNNAWIKRRNMDRNQFDSITWDVDRNECKMKGISMDAIWRAPPIDFERLLFISSRQKLISLPIFSVMTITSIQKKHTCRIRMEAFHYFRLDKRKPSLVYRNDSKKVDRSIPPNLCNAHNLNGMIAPDKEMFSHLACGKFITKHKFSGRLAFFILI